MRLLAYIVTPLAWGAGLAIGLVMAIAATCYTLTGRIFRRRV